MRNCKCVGTIFPIAIGTRAFLFLLLWRHPVAIALIPIQAPAVLARIPSLSTPFLPRKRTVGLAVSLLSRYGGGIGDTAKVPKQELNSPILADPPIRYATAEEVLSMTQVVEGERDSNAKYRSGIGTLRSSAHRVKTKPRHRTQNPKPKNKAGQETETTDLPGSLCREHVLGFDMSKYNLREAFAALLKRCDPEIVGTFRNPEEKPLSALEDFVLPANTLNRKRIGGCCEETQKQLSEIVAADGAFLQIFDQLVDEVILPHLSTRLIQAGAMKDDKPLTFYVQRPPTCRLQPGPARAGIKPHHDGEYGHQNGELNFWLPLTDRKLNQVDLWCETSHKAGDYHAIEARIGEIISFHGSSCRHFVNRNESDKTRMSMDFRIGVEGFFDPCWQMNGTTDDHGRREVIGVQSNTS